MPIYGTEKYGNLFIKFSIVYPTDYYLSAEQVNQLRAILPESPTIDSIPDGITLQTFKPYVSPATPSLVDTTTSSVLSENSDAINVTDD